MQNSNQKNRLFDLSGKVAIVTGGLGLLGSQFANTLSNAGARVVLFDLKEHEQALTFDDSKFLFGDSKFLFCGADITREEDIKRAFTKILINCDIWPDILINCAGIDSKPDAPSNQNGPFEDYPEETWDAVLDSHLKGAFLVSREFLKVYKSAKFYGGSIINISSTYGLVAPDQSLYEYRHKRGEQFFKPISYSVAKAGMIGFTKALAEYCAPFGIRVNALVPGGVRSNQDEEFVREYEKRTMLGRMAQPDDYNGAILFLASDASAYMTGAALVVDGGWTAR